MDIREKFPGIEPITKAPSMQTVNGIGMRLYGHRDFDPESNTYIATLCFCVFYIPLFAVKAFRVLPDGDGWYFIGRHPLSTYAKLANGAVAAAIIALGVGIGWSAHTGTAEYKAGQQLAAAKADAGAGRVAEAANAYRQVYASGTSHRPAAATAIADLMGAPLDKAPASAAAQAISIALLMEVDGKVNLYQRGLELIDANAAKDPAGALEIAKVIDPLAKDKTILDERRHKLLENLVAAKPNDIALLSQLAGVYERKRDFAKCQSLLEPHAKSLGESEGARILGQIYADQNRIEESFGLLNNYTTARLKRLHNAEQAFESTYNAAADAIVAELRKGTGPKSFYDKLNRASETEKPVLVDEYIWAQLKDRPDLVDKRTALQLESDIVPVALDLGIVRLRRAQGMSEPAARKTELEAAEQTFLAIKGQAGQSDTFNLFFAQVKYWLGKHQEGKALFDQILTKNGRDFKTLTAIANSLRDLGEVGQARTMAEEAYNKTNDTKEKHAAAQLRSLMHKDDDEEILWLGRSNQADPHIKASLAATQGRVAMRQGDDATAARHLREAAAIYESMPVQSGSLNNGAIAYLTLYYVTGDPADIEKSIVMQEKALAMNPSDAILLFNTAHMLAEAAMRDIIGAAVDFKLLKTGADLRQAAHLYHDEASRRALAQRIKNHAGFSKAVAYFERSRVLSSKRASTYEFLARYRMIIEDLAGLRLLVEQARGAGIDIQEQVASTLDFYRGTKDEAMEQDMAQTAKRAEERLARVRAGGAKGATLGIAIESVLEARMSSERLSGKAGVDAIFALAEEWHRVAPSSRSRDFMIGAYLQRAGVRIAAEDPRYKQMASLGERALGHIILMAMALERGGPLSEKVGKDPDVQRAFEMIRQELAAYPSKADPFAWAMFKNAHPADAQTAAQRTQKDELARLDRELDLLLTPVNGSVLVATYWTLLIENKKEEAEKLLRDAAARGVPLP